MLTNSLLTCLHTCVGFLLSHRMQSCYTARTNWYTPSITAEVFRKSKYCINILEKTLVWIYCMLHIDFVVFYQNMIMKKSLLRSTWITNCLRSMVLWFLKQNHDQKPTVSNPVQSLTEQGKSSWTRVEEQEGVFLADLCYKLCHLCLSNLLCFLLSICSKTVFQVKLTKWESLHGWRFLATLLFYQMTSIMCLVWYKPRIDIKSFNCISQT